MTMRDEIIDINDISDSKEVMLKKSPPAITIFISIIAMALISAIIWSCFGQIDEFFSASGEIRTKKFTSMITLTNGGKIKNVLLTNGAQVKKGDTILEIDSDSYKAKEQIIYNQINERQKQIDNYNKLINSIKTDKNLFNNSTESKYYYQFENYKSELESALNQIEIKNEQVSNSKKEYEYNKNQAEKEIRSLESLYKEYSDLYTDIKSDKSYDGSDNVVLGVYTAYLTSLQKAQNYYDSSVKTYEELNKLMESSTSSVTKEQIDKAEASKSSALIDLKSIKATKLGEISTKMFELKQQIKTNKANADSYSLKINVLSYDKTKPSTIERIKSSYYTNVNNSITGLEEEIKNLKSQKIELEKIINDSVLRAEQDGVLVFSQDLSEGDVIGTGATVATIVPTSGNFIVYIYIPERYAADVKVGQKAEYSFRSISSTDYGKVFGKIETISNDSFLNQSDGQKYYKVTASIDKNVLERKKGDKLELKVGMIAEVHVITGKQSVFSWMMDKLNFSD